MNRDVIKNALICYFESDLRKNCIQNGFSEKHTNDALNIMKVQILENVENNLRLYEDNLFAEAIKEITNRININILESNRTFNNSFGELKVNLETNHIKLDEKIENQTQFQKALRIKLLGEEIEVLSLNLKLLEKHKDALNKLATKESNKVSWLFVLLCSSSFVLWSILIYIFKWDAMEKWTYLSGGIVIVIDAIYFAFYERNINSQDLKKAKFENIINFNYNFYKFDSDIITNTEKLLAAKKEELKKIFD